MVPLHDPMKQATQSGKARAGALVRALEVRTTRRTELQDITEEVEKLVGASGVSYGVCHIYVSHTTAGVTINEHDDPDVARDIEATLDRLVPTDGSYRHGEGNADSHVKATLVGASQTVFIEDGQLTLGRWQGIFFCEFDGPRRRQVHVKIVPDSAA